jgi:hypothetical protein
MYLTILGALGIVFLMIAAVFTHIRVKNPFHKMFPAFGLILLNLVIILFIYKQSTKEYWQKNEIRIGFTPK